MMAVSRANIGRQTFGNKAKNKVKKVMSEFKAGTLKSSSGPKVIKKKQAIAIALSEARRERRPRRAKRSFK